MTGLEKIVKKIEEDCVKKCEDIIEKADNEASALIAKARNDANTKAENILLKAHNEADNITAIAKSSAETVTKTKYLEVKNAVINDIISAAYEEVLNLNTDDYFELLFKLCVRYVDTGECVMLLNKHDLSALPKNFEDKINSTVYEKAAVQVSKEAVDIENGFILDYGKFIINCTLKNIFDEKKDEFRDLLKNELFSADE